MKAAHFKTSFFLCGMLILPVSLALNSCGTDQAKAETGKQETITKELAEEDLFSGDVVRTYLLEKNPFIQDAQALFMQALDLYKNKKDVHGAIPLFIESLKKNPESRSYYELGNASLDNGDIDRAIESYQMAEKLGYEPFSKILYNLACAHSKKEDYDMAAQYLEYSIQAGYSNLDHIAKDKDLEKLRKEQPYSYNASIEKGTRGMSDSKTLFWLQFKKPFVKVKLPYTISGDKKQFVETGYIPYDFEKYISEMRDEKFSREVSKTFYYSAEIASNERFVAFIYAVEDAFMEENAPVLYRLATYTPEGKLIDKKVIGGHEALDEPLKTATIGKDMVITVKSFDLEYERDPNDDGYENNPVKSKKLSGTEKWKITADGKIVAA